MMKTKMNKRIAAVAVMTMVLSMGSMTAFAEESYSYTIGQQRSQERNSLYAQSEALESEEERDAFLKEHGIGDTEWSEETAASYSYVAGQQRGASYRIDETNDESDTDRSAYSYMIGQQRGSGYRKE